jgi:hypothetical protein
LAIIAASLLLLLGCGQGAVSEKPPIHLNPNMDSQEKYKAQAASKHFEDGATMRVPVEGTVARGQLREGTAFYHGVDSNGKPVTQLPIEVTGAVLKRGRERFDIYCAACHGPTGDGRSRTVELGFTQPPDLRADSTSVFPDGQIYDIITNGVRNMPSYRQQIPVADRWAIIAHLRQLQNDSGTGGKK